MSHEQEKIVQLKPACWEILKDLKLRSVAEEPVAFSEFDTLVQDYIERTDDEWKEWLENKNRISVFAKDGDRVVGMVSALLGDNTAYVQHMYVENESRGIGIGKNLLGSLLDKAKEKGMKKATLAVLETQTTAISLYGSLGFKTTARHEVLRNDMLFEEILMEKEL